MLRDAQETLKQYIERTEVHKNVLIVEGARQVGKTYLISDYLETQSGISVVSINLEKDRLFLEKMNRCHTLNDLSTILAGHGFSPNQKSILFIDEAQECAALGPLVRFMKEDWKNVAVILSGSSMQTLFGDNRVPVGRVEYLRLYPYSFNEFLRALGREELLDGFYAGNFETSLVLHQELLEKYDQFLRIGGLPRVVHSFAAGEAPDRQENIRQEIFLSQEDDFYRKEKMLKPDLFRKAVGSVSNLLGFPFVLSRISHNHREASTVFALLKKWHLAIACEQKSFAATTEFHPKAYLYDIGLARALRETSLPQLSLIDTALPDLRTALGG
jgi:predicted AAA+ superfamily ATPase